MASMARKAKHKLEAKARSFWRGPVKWCQFCSDPPKSFSCRFMLWQCCLHHCLTGRGNIMSHWHSRTVQTLQHYVKTSLSTLCYIRNWLAELCKVRYGWPGGFAHQATRPLVWKLTTNIQNEVRIGLAFSMFIKDWEFFFFFCPATNISK